MKTVFSSNVWCTITAMLLITFLAASCSKKKNDPEPDLATKVSGTYKYSELSHSGKTLPADDTNLKGTITVSRLSEDKVKIALDLRLKSNNEAFMVIEASDVTVINSASSVDLIYNGERIAGVVGKKITINGVDEDGTSFTIAGEK